MKNTAIAKCNFHQNSTLSEDMKLNLDKVYSLAVIGCGLTGTSMLYQLINALPVSAGTKISLILFEKNNQPGPGLPYADENVFPFHLCNMPAEDMSIVADCPDDFIDWVNSNRHALAQRYPELGPFLMPKRSSRLPGSACLPRIVMGHYLRNRFNDALQMSRKKNVNISIQARVEVTGLNDSGSVLSIEAVDLETKALKRFSAKYVLLATGHWFENKKRDRYFSSPWPAPELIRSIPEGTKTAILGTSLSAIDTVLTLSSHGTFSRQESGCLSYHPCNNPRQITMYSRNGLLPKVRGRKGRYENRYFNNSELNNLLDKKNESLLLKDIFCLLNKELENAYGRKMNWESILKPGKNPLLILKQDISRAIKGDSPNGDILWQTILSQVTPLFKKAYLNLTDSQRMKFETQFKSVFMTYATPIPLLNAEKIHALMTSGILSVKNFQNAYQIKPSHKSSHFNICYRDRSGNDLCDPHDYIVNATGQMLSYVKNSSRLAQNMIATGLVWSKGYRSESSGDTLFNQSPIPKRRTEPDGIRIDPQTHCLVTKTKSGRVNSFNKIFAIGIMNRSQIINASMAYECAVSAKKVTDILISELIRSNH